MLAVLLAGSLVVSAPVPRATKKHPPDPERILGAWEMELSEHNGQPSSTAIWTFDERSMNSKSRPGEAGTPWGYRIDPEQSPKHFDFLHSNGQLAYSGIYEFDGEKLRIAYSGGSTRPTEFKSSPQVYLQVLVKAKDQPDK